MKEEAIPVSIPSGSELRKTMEEAQRQDGMNRWQLWIKRIIRKELKHKGIEVLVVNGVCIVFLEVFV